MTQATHGPQEEPPCIWVLAGVLSYRPCDRHYDCEACPLFQALRSGQAPPAWECEPTTEAPGPAAVRHGAAVPVSQARAYLARLLAGCTLHLDRAYTLGHWWLDFSRPPSVTLGIEEHILRMLYPIDDIVTPRPGLWLRRPEPCGWLLRGRTALPLRAPISGEVEQVNRRYLDAMRAWGALPLGDEWLLRLTPHEEADAVPGLYRGDEALAWHLKTMQLLRRSLEQAVGSPEGGVGLTMADGGEPNLNLEGVLGPARFDALVDAAFRSHAS